MVKTDGAPTIAWAGASTKDRNSKRRWLTRRGLGATSRSCSVVLGCALVSREQRPPSFVGREPDRCVVHRASMQSRGRTALDEAATQPRRGDEGPAAGDHAARSSAASSAVTRCGGGRRVRTEKVSIRVCAGMAAPAAARRATS